tara:strand:- start:357 stop:596 length:240 start_codon:yes stop_codon:yes gene_type:complete
MDKHVVAEQSIFSTHLPMAGLVTTTQVLVGVQALAGLAVWATTMEAQAALTRGLAAARQVLHLDALPAQEPGRYLNTLF